MPIETVELSIYDESDKLYEGKFEVHFDWYQFAHDNGAPDADFELHTLIHAESGRCFSEDGIGSQVQDVENAVIDVIKERFGCDMTNEEWAQQLIKDLEANVNSMEFTAQTILDAFEQDRRLWVLRAFVEYMGNE